VLATGLTGLGQAVASGRGTISGQPPVIVRTAVDTKQNLLIISGRNFGTTIPTVKLADQKLKVKHFTEQEVVANLPVGLPAANYGVTITINNAQYHSNVFSTMLPSIVSRE